MSIDDKKYFTVMFEEISDQNKAILEAVGDMQKQVRHIPKIRADIYQMKNDITAIKLVIKNLGRVEKEQNHRLDKLESHFA